MKKIIYDDNFPDLLTKLISKDIQTIEIELGISLKSIYYNDENFTTLCHSFKNTVLKFVKDYKITKFKIFLADSLNRHILYYRYAMDYLKLNNLKNQNDIPEEIKTRLMYKSSKSSRNQGVKWFKSNLDAINLLMPEHHKLSKDFEFKKEITELYKGDDENPKIELIRYDYWLHHPEYDDIKKPLEEVCSLDNGLMKKAFQYEVDYFIERLKKRDEVIQFEDLLREQSFKYLFDETISFIIKHREQTNLVEFYFGGRELKPTLTFRGKKAQKDPIIQEYLQGPLKGADQRKFVSVKMIEE